MSANSMQTAAAGQAGEGLLGVVSVFDVAPKITTVLGLAALALLIAFLLARQWLANQRRTINTALEDNDVDKLKTLLGHSGINPDKVGKAEAGEILLTDVRQRFWLKLVQYGLGLIAFLALLFFVLKVITPEKAEAKPIDPLTMAGLLKWVPPDQRLEKCVNTLDDASCKVIVELLGEAYTPPKDEAAKTAVDESLEEGTTTPQLATAAKAALSPQLRALVILGNPKGWDIDFNYCGGINAAANEAKARAAAGALGQNPGETIAPGVTLGNIRVRPVSSASQTAGAPGPGGGTIVLTDTGTGKTEAVNAMLATLTQRGVAGYTVRQMSSGPKWSIQFYNCAGLSPKFMGAATKVQLPVSPSP